MRKASLGLFFRLLTLTVSIPVSNRNLRWERYQEHSLSETGGASRARWTGSARRSTQGLSRQIGPRLMVVVDTSTWVEWLIGSVMARKSAPIR